MITDLWPETIYYAPLAIALLRITAGIYTLYIASTLVEREHAFTHIRFPFITHAPLWLVWVSALLTALVGVSLVVGFYTQLMALAGMIMAIKHLFLARSHPYVFPLAAGTYVLLFVVFFVLFVCGTGTFGVDLTI